MILWTAETVPWWVLIPAFVGPFVAFMGLWLGIVIAVMDIGKQEPPKR